MIILEGLNHNISIAELLEAIEPSETSIAGRHARRAAKMNIQDKIKTK
jgi:hypothetical protein